MTVFPSDKFIILLATRIPLTVARKVLVHPRLLPIQLIQPIARLHLSTMSSSVDVIVSQLFERDPPVLEPGTAVWDKKLVKDIEGLTEHSFVIAGK